MTWSRCTQGGKAMFLLCRWVFWSPWRIDAASEVRQWRRLWLATGSRTRSWTQIPKMLRSRSALKEGGKRWLKAQKEWYSLKLEKKKKKKMPSLFLRSWRKLNTTSNLILKMICRFAQECRTPALMARIMRASMLKMRGLSLNERVAKRAEIKTLSMIWVGEEKKGKSLVKPSLNDDEKPVDHLDKGPCLQNAEKFCCLPTKMESFFLKQCWTLPHWQMRLCSLNVFWINQLFPHTHILLRHLTCTDMRTYAIVCSTLGVRCKDRWKHQETCFGITFIVFDARESRFDTGIKPRIRFATSLTNVWLGSKIVHDEVRWRSRATWQAWLGQGQPFIHAKFV